MRPALDPRSAALLHVAVSAAIGSAAVCLEWSISRALAAGAIQDEMPDMLLSIAPLAGSSAPPPMCQSRSGTTSRRDGETG
jgi:alkylhydroperoxidase/carboxymuconolactone decarboxylase family protein YurZ